MLIAIAVLTVLAGWRASQIGFNYDFEAFFPEGQPETAFYLQFREAFSTDNDFILVGLKGENGVFDRDFLGATRDLASALDTVEGVTGVIDPTDLTLPVRDPALGMVFQRPLLRWDAARALCHRQRLHLAGPAMGRHACSARTAEASP